MNKTRIMLVDDHEVARLGLKALIERQPNLVVVAEAATGKEALALACLHVPDVLLMDIRLLGSSGIDACREIKAVLPKTKVIMLTSYADDDLLFRSIGAGANGYLLKEVGGREIIRAIEAVGHNQAILDPNVTRHVFDEVRTVFAAQDVAAFGQLSDRECDVLAGVANGETNRQIALLLHLGEGTVRNYVSNILARLKISNRAQAASYAIRHHLKETLSAVAGSQDMLFRPGKKDRVGQHPF